MDDILGDVTQLAVAVLANPAQDREGPVLVQVSVPHQDAHRHADPAVSDQGGPQLDDFFGQVRGGGMMNEAVAGCVAVSLCVRIG